MKPDSISKAPALGINQCVMLKILLSEDYCEFRGIANRLCN